jgi:hypothetical protein
MNEARIRQRLGLVDLCPLIQVRLSPIESAGFSLSVPHYRPCPIQIEPPDWTIQPRPAVGLAFDIQRKIKPMSVDREYIRLSYPTSAFSWTKRLAVVAEVADLIRSEGNSWMAATYPIHWSAQSRQREHIPLALVDDDQEVRWINPAAKAHGLVGAEFPTNQRHRLLGDEIPWDQYDDAYAISAEDEATGLPVWFLATKNELAPFDIHESDLTRSIIRFHAIRCARLQKSRKRKPFVDIAVEEYLSTFKRYFGSAPQGFAQAIAV